jgi:hypothetical protein
MGYMNGGGNHTTSQRSLQVSHREALALLAALELAPFDDETLTQKLLDLVYREAPAHPTSARPRATRDFKHHRRERA